MAMVLDTLCSYLLNMLTEMTKEEVKILLGAYGEMEKMSDKLRDLKNFLADADRRNFTEEVVRGWVRELKDAMYDATNIMDLCELKAAKCGKNIDDAGCINPLLFCMRNPLFAYDIGSRMKKLNQKLDDIAKRSAAFNFINNQLDREVQHGEEREATTSEVLNVLDLVGEKIEEDTRHLVELLTKEETTGKHNEIMVFAIVGVSGIGKTTLAKRIYNDDTIKKKFTKRLWLSVSKDFHKITLLKKVITEAGGDHQAPDNSTAAVTRTLMNALMGERTILVMDNVWDHKAWVDVLETPLAHAVAQGSRVLVTTRYDMVAREMKAVKPYHRVDKLKPEDAWSLLKNKAGINDRFEVRELKDIGMKIIEKCDGLPLAIKVMGGLLLQKERRPSHWESVLNDSIWSVFQMPEELEKAIYLSYQDLCPNLKACFLHLSLLPKSAVFFVDDIVSMWISEGFVYGQSCNHLEELAKGYYHQLILRNLIEPDIMYVDQQVCIMHDVVRSFAQYVARDEAITINNSQMDIANKLNSQKFIRLSLETKELESNELDWISRKAQKSLRTLISVGNLKIKHGDSLLTFPCLRTLHIRDADFDALTGSLGQLKHLRYLSIENTNTSILPESICELKFLHHISLLDCKSLKKLPGSIIKLQNLRFLDLRGTNIKNVPRGFSCLTNLRILYGFPAYMDGHWCSLEELGTLSKLTLLQINGLSNISSSLFAQKARLAEKEHLRKLLLYCRNFNHGGDVGMVTNIEDTSDRNGIEELFEELRPPFCLEYLDITGYFGQRLPKWMMSTIITILVMNDLPFCLELPDSLCQSRFLEFLKIKGAQAITRIGSEYLQAHSSPVDSQTTHNSPDELQIIECPSLQSISDLPTQELTIIRCPELKIVEGMPWLRKLILVDNMMKTLPGYLKNVNPLHLEVDCNISLLTSMAAEKSSPEWDRFSHIKHVKAYANDGDNDIQRKWYITYTRDPFIFKTNISPLPSAQSAGNASG